MRTRFLYKGRFIWLLVIVLISFGLVSAALAAANHADRMINNPSQDASKSQNSAAPVRSVPPVPMVSSATASDEHPSPGSIGDELRLSAMKSYEARNSSKSPDDINRFEFWNNPSGLTWMWGGATPNQTITITTSGGNMLVCWVDEDGEFVTDFGVYIYPGDLVTATDELGGYNVMVTFPELQANSDSTTDLVSGQISYPNHEIEIHPDWDDTITTTTDEDGYFTQQFEDIPPQGRGYIRFIEPLPPYDVEIIFHRAFYDLQPTIHANYAHDWIEGVYDPGYHVWITVTNEMDEIRATGNGVTGDPGWGGDTGFATWSNLFTWDEANPDIQVWDKVYVTLSNERSADVPLGEITGAVDVISDTFQGNLNVPWLTDPVWVDCGVWTNDGVGMGMEVDPNGGSITCDFSGIYDILPGMDVGVGYWEEGDQVINVFRQPAPDLWINLWGQGMPAFGNNYILEVHYGNDGWLSATGVTIQQSYLGMTYLADTSGFPHTGTGDPADPIIWEVGELPYSHISEQVFYVFVQVDELPGNSVFASTEIHSSMDYYQDEGRLYSSWESEVSDDSDSDLNIGMWAWTWAPAPGQDYVYAINVCNNDQNSSSQVYITDTLPISTTLLNWWGQEPGWESVMEEPNQLVLARPTLSGNQCTEIYINVHLSEQAEQDMKLHNEAWVWAASDPDLDNNHAEMEHPVGSPTYNLHLQSDWIQGQFVPGGQINIQYGVSNWGNMPITGTLVTTTLPADVEYSYAFTWDWGGWKLYTPTLVTDEYLVWDLGNLLNGYNKNIGIQFEIAEDVVPGTQLVFNSSVMGEELEYRYDDNHLTYRETINGNGPNLRVDKHTNWGWNWEGQLYYELRILNIGTLYLEDPIVTDTYPISTTVESCWWGHGPITSCEVDEENHQVIYYLDYLNSGETASAMLSVNLAPEDIGVPGLTFTNQADISDFGDITPQDNHDEVSFVTGPDVFVHKWLKAGDVLAGEIITYTVEFGNYARGPWSTDPEMGSHITETLPQGMTFIQAINYGDPSTPWEPEIISGQQVVWGWSPLWPDDVVTFDLVVQIDADVPAGSALTNVIDVWGDSPNDMDVNPENNHFEYTLFTPLYRTLLPLAQRTP